MYIEELKEGSGELGEEQVEHDHLSKGALVVWNSKRVLVGAGARVLFYPTLLYNVVRNKIQPEFRWWDKVDEFLLLGAVPFPTDVPRLKALGVCGVVTLNEPYETLVSTSLYRVAQRFLRIHGGKLAAERFHSVSHSSEMHHGIDHLVIPTRDYLFAPVQQDICQAVEFIHRNSVSGKTTYVHCKAGRGRSTTIVLCYLVKHKHMTPEAAFVHVRSIRPRVLLASSQWKAVQDYYHGLKKPESVNALDNNSVCDSPISPSKVAPDDLDYSSLVMITHSDLDGYVEEKPVNSIDNQKSLAEAEAEAASLACRVQFARQVAISRLSCLWLRGQKKPRKEITSPVRRNIGVDIPVC